MKKLAFFIAVFVGLNATSVVRRPEEEEPQSIVQYDKHPGSYRKYSSVIQSLAYQLNYYFFVITRDGIFHQISWERISSVVTNLQAKSRVNRILYKLEDKFGKENSDIQIIN